MPAPTLAVIKRLFALSRNKCAFPECGAPMVEESGTATGEICHIKAASPGGSRFDPKQTDGERHGASNLLLLCARHHKVVDTELRKYTVAILEALKRKHEQAGMVEITPAGAKAAKVILDSYRHIVIHSNVGQITIGSPGAIQANTLNLKTTKAKVKLLPPSGSIADDRAMLSYAKYLIDRYQQYQKADTTKSGAFKYMAIHSALKREFKGDWKLLHQSRFHELVAFLQRRVNNTRQGRINKAGGIRNFHAFGEHA